MGEQSDICLSFSVLGVSLMLPFSICLWTLCNSVSYRLTWRKKKGGIREKIQKEKRKK